MNRETEEFITQFRNLTGTTVGEKQASLRRCLNSLSPDAAAALDFCRLQLATRLEEKLKTEALVHLRRTRELFDLLKSEDAATVKRIFKLGPWFFEKMFEHTTGTQLVNDLFPHVSYSVKMKLLNKLAVHLRNVEQADGMFQAVKDKYGLSLAVKLLPACSFEIVLLHIDGKLPPQQLLSIVKKHAQHPKVLETLTKYNIKKHCNKVLVFFKLNYFEEIVLQHEHFEAYRKLGKRLTGRFISKRKEEVIADPRRYYEMLHNKQIPKSLRGDFPRFFANLYPSELDQFGESEHRDIVTKLSTLPAKLNGPALYLATFRKLYGSEIWDHPEYVTENLLKGLRPEERESRLKIEYKKELSEDEWMALHKTAVSIPFFLKRISLTSDIDARLDLVKLLVKTCAINVDLDGLEQVCSYMMSRHRNDHLRIRVSFMTSVLKNFKLENLGEAHWSGLNDMLQLFEMNQESLYDKEKFEQGYIHYRLRNNLPVLDLLKLRVLAMNRTFNIIEASPQYEKFCLVTFGALLNEGRHQSLYSHYLSALINWNNRHKEDEISPFHYPKMIEDFQAVVTQGGYVHNSDSISGYLLTKSDNKCEYLPLYLMSGRSYRKDRILDNLVKTLPEVVGLHLEKAVGVMLDMRKKSSTKFWRHCQYLPHLNLPQTVIGLCLEICKDNNRGNSLRENAFFAVTSLMSRTELGDFAKSYTPPTDSHVDRDKQKFAHQKLLCKHLKNSVDAREGALIALQYCKSDYFRFVRGSLFSMCGRIREDKVGVILNELKSKMEYKRSLQIAARAMPLDYQRNILRELMGSAKKAHTRRFLLKTVFRWFLKDASDYHWELVKENLRKINVKDKESLDLFIQPRKIPTSYLITYQTFAWGYLFRLPNKEGELDPKRKSLIDSVTDEGSQLLPVDFCEDIIKGYLFKSDDLDGLHSSVQLFGTKYVVYCRNEDEQERRLEFLMNILKYYVGNRWYKRREFRQKAQAVCSNLVQTFGASFLNNGDLDKGILRKFYAKWLEIVPSREAFSDYLFLRLVLMHASDTFVQEFVELCQEIVGIYGLVTVDFIYMAFKEVYHNHLNAIGEFGRYDIIDKLISTGYEPCALIAILAIDDNEPCESDIVKRHNLIIEKLQKKETMAVNIFLNRHIRGTTSLEYY